MSCYCAGLRVSAVQRYSTERSLATASGERRSLRRLLFTKQRLEYLIAISFLFSASGAGTRRSPRVFLMALARCRS